MMKKLLLLLVCVAPICLSSCASNQGGSGAAAAGGTKTKKSAASGRVPDHEPKIDFWQNGGGACCPYHAQVYQEQVLAGRGKRGA